ncbi:helix-turn-helix transcriptional regulator [Bradyrhizobium sp. DASA03007]|uniref:helix-turn-helix transcriptional regulator n=1 Tax=unclassified Bradyrhizobium TaxID=2631580 RepID=UPI003F715D6F
MANSSKKFLSGDEVKAFRVSRNLTQADLADWLGLTTQAVGKYEVNGATKTTALALSAIDRGLQPFKPTKADLHVLASRGRMKALRTKES